MKRTIRSILSFVLAVTILTASAASASALSCPFTVTDCFNKAGCAPDGCGVLNGVAAICRTTGSCLDDLLSRFIQCRDHHTLPLIPSVIAPTEAPAIAPTEAVTEMPTQSATEAPAPLPTDSPDDAPAVTPAEVPTEAPADEPDEEVYHLNEYEQKVAELINDIRRSNGLGTLSINTQLSRVARVKAQEMHDKRYFDHNSPTYGTPFEMMRSFGVRYRTAGENIAMGYRTPQAVVDGWMNSDGHRANILNPNFTEIGMGYVADGAYWSQMFIG